MKTILLIIMVAIVLEAVVEDGQFKTAITQGITILLGIAFAFIFNLQLFNDALSEFYEGLHIEPIIDVILTGILFSRGSNYFSDLISRLIPKKPQSIQIMYGDGTSKDEFLGIKSEDGGD